MTRSLPGGPAASNVGWRPWCASAFAEARAADAPVLLSLGPAWCRATAAMATETYADPAIAQLIADRFVAVRVDADARPDIADRYSLGGWPTTVFLTPDGDLLGGETYIRAERMRELLPQVADAFAAQRDEIVARRGPAAVAPLPAAAPDETMDGWFASHLLDQFDPAHGGFGNGPKRVHAAALEYAARRAAAGDEALAHVVDRTLCAIGWGGLYDEVNGGVFRYCFQTDWTEPATEKLLDMNAAVLRLLLARDGKEYRDRAAHLIRYVRRTLLGRPEGRAVFFASQRADPDYYAGETLSPPPVDRAVYADCTALMVRAWARAATVLGDETLLADAVDALEHIVAGTYERGGGIAHGTGRGDGGAALVRGLLGDQVAASAALLDLYAATDRDVYLDMAEELMLFCLHHLWDDAVGGFRDRVHAHDDIGLLREAAYPFTVNCDAARVLLRLARLTGQSFFLDRAVSTLAAQTAVARSHGPDAGSYVLALQDLGARSFTAGS